MKLEFYLRFRTHFGQTLFITGDIPSLGKGAPARALPMQFLNEDYWYASLDADPKEITSFSYRYIFINEHGEVKKDADKDRFVDLRKAKSDFVFIDTWNDDSFTENAFGTAPFKEVLLKNRKTVKIKRSSGDTYQFRVKAPLLSSNEVLCMLGSAPALGNWNPDKPLIMQKTDDWWVGELEFSGSEPLAYKYGIYNEKKDEFSNFELGDNRVLFSITGKKVTVHDGFVRLPDSSWKGAGIAIPVFALRTKTSFGIGEFSDIKVLVDWAVETGMKLIQLLPVNDTSATFSWRDSYPYAAISAFALHPIYANLPKVAGKKHGNNIKSLGKKQKQLNALPEIDYEQVIQFKMAVLRELYDLDALDFLEEEEYKSFFEENRHWLIPYAAFCHFRDKWGTSDFSKWKTNAVYVKEDIDRMATTRSKSFRHLAFHFFIQYHLHQQLKEASGYAHKKGIVLKGDIPIGIYRYGSDAWTAPQLYNMDMQAGAPPDDFTIKGQNWGFPTYNWKKMEEDHFEWWRYRFSQMSNYFDAFRIDHILGFFRIWSIPVDAVEGILGRFIPALPLDITEFGEKGIWFDYDRFCKPYITESVLALQFGQHAEFVRNTFLEQNGGGQFSLREDFSNQRAVSQFFEGQDNTEENRFIRQGLLDLISNVILYEHPGSGGKKFHFRILIDLTTSFQQLDEGTKNKLKELYVDYFYRRQDHFWKEEAMKKLPALKDSTNMLICGEDLGMVPHCVPEVMKGLGILSLEIQRMPKNPHTEFFHPKDAPYLSVITPSTHDMSTIRGWWEESREKTQRFFNVVLGEGGTAPYFCEPWINRAIILQHLYSPAMWSVFQIQDILGMSESLRRNAPQEERINNPANPAHYWNYRMHMNLEELLTEKEFNKELADYITHSGRG